MDQNAKGEVLQLRSWDTSVLAAEHRSRQPGRMFLQYPNNLLFTSFVALDWLTPHSRSRLTSIRVHFSGACHVQLLTELYKWNQVSGKRQGNEVPQDQLS